MILDLTDEVVVVDEHPATTWPAAARPPARRSSRSR
jgi:hypothetical protein